MKDKPLIILFIFVMLTAGVFVFYKTDNSLSSLSADSGFDSSWDSGSDWGGSDWGSSDWGGSSWDYDYDTDYSSSRPRNYSYSSSAIPPWIAHIIIIFIIGFIWTYVKKKSGMSYSSNYVEHALNENRHAIEAIIREMPRFDKEQFYSFVYKNFVKVQTAWMNFDYESLRMHLTDELYNTYKSQLKTLELKKQVNVMKGFELVDRAIQSFSKSNKEYTIELKFRIKFFDYLTTQKGNLLRGNDKKRLVMTYSLTYVKSISDKPNKCPNCNAPLENNASSVCPFCNSTVVSDKHGFVLAKKEVISQRTE